MATVTVKINERTGMGKAIMDLLRSSAKEKNIVEFIETPVIQKSHYNAEFVAKIKKAETNIKKGNTTRLNPDDIWGSIL